MSNIVVASGQITIVDLTDSRSSSLVLQANQSRVQTYNPDIADENARYEPNYRYGALEITPILSFGGQKVDITDSTKISYKIYLSDGSVVMPDQDEGALVPVQSGTCAQRGAALIIKENVGMGKFANTKTIRIVATLSVGAATDPETELSNPEMQADIDFTRMDSGASGRGVYGVRQLFIFGTVDQNGILNIPTPPSSPDNLNGWSPDIQDPESNRGNYLWVCTETVFSNGDSTYTTPYTDPSWAEARDQYASLQGQIDKVQDQLDKVIDTWYKDSPPPSDPVGEGLWTDDDAYHVGDLYFDKKNAITYRLLFDDPDEGDLDTTKVYYWKPIGDEPISNVLSQLIEVSATVDGKATIYYGDTIPDGANPKTGDLLVKTDGSFWSYDQTLNGGTGGWEIASKSISRVEYQFTKQDASIETAPGDKADWSTASPKWEDGKYIWQRTVTYFNGDQAPEASEAVCISAAAAKGIVLTGEQVFHSSDNGEHWTGPITLTANCLGGLKVSNWYYKNSENEWVLFNNVETGAETITVYATDNALFAGEATQATIKVISDSDKYFDIISIYKVVNGNDGEPARFVYMANDNIAFSADATGSIIQNSVSYSTIIGIKGETEVAPSVRESDIAGIVDGMTIKLSNQGNRIQVAVTVAKGAKLGNDTSTSGVITIPVDSPIKVDLSINWTKTNTGQTGAPGAPAVKAEVQSKNNRVQFTDLMQSDIELTASLYEGSDRVADGHVVYQWSSVPVGDIPAGQINTSMITVGPDDVKGSKTYACTMTFKGKTYSDFITIEDRYDQLTCSIHSSAGDTFLNNKISSTLTCVVFENGVEVDVPNDPNWNYIFEWSKYDGSGQEIAWSPKPTTQSITIGPSDVKNKAIFSCSVSRTQKTV